MKSLLCVELIECYFSKIEAKKMCLLRISLLKNCVESNLALHRNYVNNKKEATQ